VTLDELLQAGRNFASAGEARAILGVDERTVYTALERGEIPSVRVGNRYKVPVRWLAQQAGISGPGQPPAPAADPEMIAAAVAERVVAQFARALAVLAAGPLESP
jgi:excisionase family DNA binding protein